MELVKIASLKEENDKIVEDDKRRRGEGMI